MSRQTELYEEKIAALESDLAEARATAKAHPLCKEGYVTKLRAEVSRLRDAVRRQVSRFDADLILREGEFAEEGSDG